MNLCPNQANVYIPVIVCLYCTERRGWVSTRSVGAMVPVLTTYSLALSGIHHTASVLKVFRDFLYVYKL
jgi:hypothetical protein